MNSTWNTTEDVLNDLAQLGQGQINAFDESYIVRSGKPPPQLIEDEDDEVMERYGAVQINGENKYNNDFRGITEMLRMVDELKENTDTTNDGALPGKQTQLVISKLNPNVQEFVPKSLADSSHVNNVNKVVISNGSNGHNENIQGKSNIDQKEETNSNEAILKKKIITKATTLKDKKEKNVAIAALIKLNSTAVKSPQKPLPPDSPTIYSNSPSNSKSQNFDSELQISPRACEENDDTPDTKPLVLIKPDFYKSKTKETEAATGPVVTAELETKLQMLEEKESRDKVEGWFDRNEKSINGDDITIETPVVAKIEPKAKLVPVIEPIGFKRKNTPSSSNNSPSIPEVGKPKHSTPSYVPSTYANELAKKYEDKSKNKVVRDNRNIWTKLEDDLKAKDMEIRKRQGN